MQLIFFLSLSVCLLFPTNIAFSQDAETIEDYYDQYPDEHPGFFDRNALIKMTPSLEAALLGKNELIIAREYRDLLQAHYDRLIKHLEDTKDVDLAKIERQRDIMMWCFNDRVKKAEDREDYFNSVMFVIHAVLTDGADSVGDGAPDKPNSVISNFMPIHQEQTKQNIADVLNGHIASQISNSGSAISFSSPSQTYNIDAGLPVVSQDDAANNGNNGGSDINILKPLRFTNNGLYDATVRVFSYTPAEGVTASMSRASTVVLRGSNSSAYLDLPLGTYVFCYYWDLGTDADNDGYVDYAHRNTGSVTLSAASSDNASSAQVVALSPENMNSLNGKCGETAPRESENADNLTPQESANQGTHTYSGECDGDGWDGGQWGPFVMVFDFVEGGFNLSTEEGDFNFQKIGTNSYTGKDDDVDVVITFTDVGFIYEGKDLIWTAIRT